jgi:glycosyltransferase involved in cell wall biosynthesis
VKKILFLSAIDFKEKSIQIIRKTPEHFVQLGWEVDYVVFRDKSKAGNYFYESEINPEGINTERHYYPFNKVRNVIHKGILSTMLNKLTLWIIVFNLTLIARKKLKNKRYDVVYGYEAYGVLALRILRKINAIKHEKTVSRFQGTWLTSYKKNKQRLKYFLNLDMLFALRTRSDLCIMTDDGTEGNYFYKTGMVKHPNFKFWINGVDNQILEKQEYDNLIHQFKSENNVIFISISRLEPWKQVERVIMAFSKLAKTYNRKNIQLIIVGDGIQMEILKKKVSDLNILEQVYFTGAIPHSEVKKYLNVADCFISAYDLSNVGNPLLEAIRAEKIIFTLNNGDTSSWIKHEVNGFIYDIDSELTDNMAKDMNRIIDDTNLQEKIKENIQATIKHKLWTWKERMDAEVNEVEKLLYEN